MTTTTEAQARAIAEALGWEAHRDISGEEYWVDKEHSTQSDVPTLETDRAMCMDAVEWLSERADLAVIRFKSDKHGLMHRVVVGNGATDAHDADTLPAALRAAMIKELGI